MLMKPRLVVNHLFLFQIPTSQYISTRNFYFHKNANFSLFKNYQIFSGNNNKNCLHRKNAFLLNSFFKRDHVSFSKNDKRLFHGEKSKTFLFFRSVTTWKINCYDKSKTFINRIKKNINDKFDKHFSSDGISLKQIYSLLKSERKYLGLAMMCLIVSSVGQFFFPLCVSKIINLFGGKEESVKYIMKEVYKTVFLILCISTFSFFRIFFIETSIEKITKKLRTSLFEKIMNQNLSFFDKQKTGELINRLSNDIEISSKILIHLSFAIRNFIAAVVGGICALHISPSKLFTSFLVPVSACLLIGTTYGKFVKKISIKKQEQLSNCIDFASERLYNISSVRLLNGEAYEKKKFQNCLNDLYKIGKKYSLVKAGNHCIFFSIISLFILHLIYYGNYLIANHFINVGDLFSLIMYSLLSGSGIQGVMQSFADIQKCLGSCSKVLQIINLNTKEICEKWDEQTLRFLKSSNFSIRFSNVSFSYEGEEKKKEIEETKDMEEIKKKRKSQLSKEKKAQHHTLKNVSFFLPHNKSVAIVGESGSGKSTILNLITKKHDIKHGVITIGDFNINQINSTALRSLLGVVTQDPFLFSDTIKYNLIYPFKSHLEVLNEQIKMLKIEEKPDEQKSENCKKMKEMTQFLQEEIEKTKEHMTDINSEQLQQIYKDFHIQTFLNKYENYDKINVGANGSFLSGGEKQRVYIAQNVLKNKKIIILDEPTSALDKLSEEIINDALRKHTKDKTTIIFTHRLALLKFVDYIGVLKDGQLIQFDLKENVLKYPCDILKRILRSTEY